jgi:hypothetical protein
MHTDFDRTFGSEPGGLLHGRKPPKKIRFFGLGGKRFVRDIAKRAKYLEFEAGDVVVWDSRLPHATEGELGGTDTREVVYTALLPPTPENARSVISCQCSSHSSQRLSLRGVLAVLAELSQHRHVAVATVKV